MHEESEPRKLLQQAADLLATEQERLHGGEFTETKRNLGRARDLIVKAIMAIGADPEPKG